MLKHGDFGPWIEKHLEFSQATANNYMKVAKNPNAVSNSLRHLYPSGRLSKQQERIKEIEDGHKTANAVHIELFEPDKQKAPASPATEVTEKAIASSLFENVRGSKEHRVTALQAIEKLLRDTEPVFRVGFWSVVNAHIDTVDSGKAAELQKRAAKCRQEFSRLIRLLKGRGES
jgi:hypothetical protein